jgi:hypothetical protein
MDAYNGPPNHPSGRGKKTRLATHTHGGGSARYVACDRAHLPPPIALSLPVLVEGILCCPYRLRSDIFIFQKNIFCMLSSLTVAEATPGLVWSQSIYVGVPVSYGPDRRLLTAAEMRLILNALRTQYSIGDAELDKAFKAMQDSRNIPSNVAVEFNSGHSTGIEYGLRLRLMEVTAFEPVSGYDGFSTPMEGFLEVQMSAGGTLSPPADRLATAAPVWGGAQRIAEATERGPAVLRGGIRDDHSRPVRATGAGAQYGLQRRIQVEARAGRQATASFTVRVIYGPPPGAGDITPVFILYGHPSHLREAEAQMVHHVKRLINQALCSYGIEAEDRVAIMEASFVHFETMVKVGPGGARGATGNLS